MALFVLRAGYRVETTATGGRVVHSRTGDALELSAVEVQLLARAMAGGVESAESGLRPIIKKMAGLGVLVPSPSGRGEAPLDLGGDLQAPDLDRADPTPFFLAPDTAVPLLRSDLEVAPAHGGQVVVRDPRSGRTASLHEFEMSLARMLNGSRRASEVLVAAQRLGIPVSLESLGHFVRQMESYGFLAPEGEVAGPPAEGTTWEPRDKWDDGTRVLFQTGLRLARRGRYPEAARYFEALLSKDPGNAQARQWLDELQSKAVLPSEAPPPPEAIPAPEADPEARSPWLVSPDGPGELAEGPARDLPSAQTSPDYLIGPEMEDEPGSPLDPDRTLRFPPIPLREVSPTEPELPAVSDPAVAGPAPAAPDAEASALDQALFGDLRPMDADSWFDADSSEAGAALAAGSLSAPRGDAGRAPLDPYVEAPEAAEPVFFDAPLERGARAGGEGRAPEAPELFSEGDLDLLPRGVAEPRSDEGSIGLEPLPEPLPPAEDSPDAGELQDAGGDPLLEQPPAVGPSRVSTSELLELDLMDEPGDEAPDVGSSAPSAGLRALPVAEDEAAAAAVDPSAVATLTEMPASAGESEPTDAATSAPGPAKGAGPRAPARSRKGLLIGAGVGLAAAALAGVWLSGALSAKPTRGGGAAAKAAPGPAPSAEGAAAAPAPDAPAVAAAPEPPPKAGEASAAPVPAASAPPTATPSSAAGEGVALPEPIAPAGPAAAPPRGEGKPPAAQPPEAKVAQSPAAQGAPPARAREPAPEPDRRWSPARIVKRGRVTMGEIKAIAAGTVSWTAQPQQRIKASEAVGALKVAKATPPELAEARQRLAELEGAAQDDPSQAAAVEAERQRLAAMEKDRLPLKAPKAGLLMPAVADQAPCKAGERLAAIVYHEAYLIALAKAEKPEPGWECRIADPPQQQRDACHIVTVVPAAGGWTVTATTAALWIDTATAPTLELAPPAP